MTIEIIRTVGQVAGIGGLAIGVLLIIFREVIRKNVFPNLTKKQAHDLLRLVVVLVFVVAIVGILAWVSVSVVESFQESRKELASIGEKSLEERVEEIEAVRMQLTNELNELRSHATQHGMELSELVGKTKVGASNNLVVRELSNELQNLLDDFKRDFDLGDLPEIQVSKIKAAESTLERSKEQLNPQIVEEPLASKEIDFISGRADAYNSWKHQQHTKHLFASVSQSQASIVSDDGNTGQFEFIVNDGLEPSTGASSGAYFTFYGNHLDRRKCRTVHFDIMVTNADGTPDVGIRFAVDDTNNDTEIATWQIDSLAGFGQPGEEWIRVHIPFDKFHKVPSEPRPEGVDENLINKLVLFVDNNIGQRFKKGSVWIRNVVVDYAQ